MMRATGSGSKNPLVQRVQRYTDMSAIFRSPTTPEPVQISESSTAMPVANTFIIPPHSVSPPMASHNEISEFIANQPQSPKTEAIPSAPPIASQETAVSTPPTIQRAAQDTSSTQTAVPTQPSAAPAEEGGLSRLKSVVQRVQRAISGEPTPAQTEEPPVAKDESASLDDTTMAVAPPATNQPNTPPTLQRKPIAPQTTQSQPSLELVPIPDGSTAPIQAELAPTPPAAPAESAPLIPTTDHQTNPAPQSVEDNLFSNRLDKIMRKHREAGTIEVPPEENQPEQTQKTAVPQSPPDHPTNTATDSSTIQRKPAISQTQEAHDSRHLDKIMQKHREAGTIDPEPPAPETAVPPSPTDQQPPSASPNPPTIQREPEAPQPPISQPQTPKERDSRRLDQIMRKHREAGTIDTPSDGETLSSSDIPFTTPAVQKKEAAPAKSEAPADPVADGLMMDNSSSLAPTSDAIDETDTLISKEPLTEETAVQRDPESQTKPAPSLNVGEKGNEVETAVSTTPPTPRPETPDTPLAETPSTPLQSAWPVQVVETPKPTPFPPPQPTAPASDTIMRQSTPEEETKLQEQLNNIPPNQKSDSSVQFIRPRKPRPQPPATKMHTIQREKTADNSSAETNKTTQSTDPFSADTTVTTEIGELPSDLWRLIGDEPPHISQQPEPPSPTQPAPFAPQVETNGEIAQPMKMIEPETVQPAFIQRTEAAQAPPEDRSTEDLAPPSDAPPAPEGENTETQQGEAEVNMDELARQVYGEIKDRMSIEWERTRGHF